MSRLNFLSHNPFNTHRLGYLLEPLAVLKAGRGAPFIGESTALDGFYGVDLAAFFTQENAGFIGVFFENQPAALFDIAKFLGKIAHFHF